MTVGDQLCGLWSEHDNEVGWSKKAPTSTQVSALKAGVALIACGDVPSHFMLRYTGTFEECETQYDRINDIGWEEWLTEQT